MKYNRDDIENIIQQENAFWSNVFKKEIASETDVNNSNKYYSSFWWKKYYDEITQTINQIISKYKSPKILEAGSGSGKASILLGKSIDRTFLDISKDALEYSKYLSNKFQCENIKYVEGDIFQMPFENGSFDFTWNIGVIEHYPDNYIEGLLVEMLRVTKQNGIVGIAFPNFNSLPIIKAKLLRLNIFKFIKGYRLGSEKKYSSNEIESIFNKVAEKSGRKIIATHIFYFGNPLFMETPKFIIQSVGLLLEKLLPKNKFLIMTLFEVV
jgi:ubiquinone/menaquinone biosynthesis C-methylase UbiE